MKKDAKSAMVVDTRSANMPIYTRTGDAGMTGLFGGRRISKADCQVETYGSIDELTSYIGLVVVKLKNIPVVARFAKNKLKNERTNGYTRSNFNYEGYKKDANFLIEIQRDLYQIMSFLSNAKIDLSFLEKKVKEFENKIDSIESKIPKLNKFIIPGGNEISSLFQILRVLCRKAERRNIDFFNNPSTSLRTNQQLTIVKYLNRLSDLFFDFARKYGKNNEVVL